MPKLTAIKNQDGSLKTYAKMIGGIRFFLGPDRATAEALADELSALWKAKKSHKGKDASWTEEEIAQAKSRRDKATAADRQHNQERKRKPRSNNSQVTIVKNADGTPKHFAKMVGSQKFFLGSNKEKAEQLALQIVQKWKAKKAHKGKDASWTDAEISAIKSLREQIYGRQQYDSIFDNAIETENTETNIQEATEPHEPDILSLGDIEDYSHDDFVITIEDASKKWQEMIAVSGRSPHAKKTLQNRLDNLGGKWEELQDKPIADLTFENIVLIINENIQQTKDNKQSAQTAKNKINALKSFIEYSDNAQKIEYKAFGNFKDYFTKQIRRLSIELKKAKKKVQKDNRLNDVDVLKNLYSNAPDNLKGYMLLSLNTGQLNTDISSLTLGMVDLENGIIERERHKTGVEGKWILWDETKDFLTQAIINARQEGRTKQDDLIFVTQQGKPLVHYSHNDYRTDSIGLAWQKLKKKCGYKGNGYAFANLRKSSSQFIRQEKGKEYSEAFLAHSDNTMAEHYNRFSDYKGLFEAIKKYRKHLSPMFK